MSLKLITFFILFFSLLVSRANEINFNSAKLNEKNVIYKKLIDSIPEEALLLAKEILEEAMSNNSIVDKGKASLIFGQANRRVGNNKEAEVSIKKAIDFLKERDEFYYSEAELLLSKLFIDQARFNEANAEALKALEIAEIKGFQTIKAKALNLIGLSYDYQNNFSEALSYYKKVKGIYEDLGDRKGVGNAYNNMGVMYDLMYEYDSAYYYYTKSINISKELGDEIGVAGSLTNLAIIILEEKKYAKADSLLQEAMEIYLRKGTPEEIAIAYTNQADLYYNIDNYNQALAAVNNSLNICREKGLFRQEIDNYELTSLIYRDMNQFDSAYHYEHLFSISKDSANATRTSMELAEMHKKYESDKKQLRIENLNKEKKQVELIAENQRKSITNLWLMAGLLFLIGGAVFLLFIFNKKNNRKLGLLNDQLLEKNTEIVDSINYAKRIQAAILPSKKIVKEYLNDSFILYKPKDIVAGDFYWMETAIDRRTYQKVILFAAADCTGHGVPGAMVSVICNNGLNRSVRELGLTDPAEILEATRNIVIQEFEKSEEEVRDGMDIALCSLNGDLLEYAGANNPLWLVRKGECIEFKADKQPIGKHENLKPYTTHSIQLKKGDLIYVFSDGYIDQFGGKKNKKFKSKAFKELILEVSSQSMDRQRELLNEAFESWKGDFEQLDDVCIIGVRY